MLVKKYSIFLSMKAFTARFSKKNTTFELDVMWTLSENKALNVSPTILWGFSRRCRMSTVTQLTSWVHQVRGVTLCIANELTCPHSLKKERGSYSAWLTSWVGVLFRLIQLFAKHRGYYLLEIIHYEKV